MTRRARLILFTAASLAVAALYAAAVLDLKYPATGYGDLINALTVPERHITDAVTAVNFDFRGFDTLGEEYIMFASVLGVALLLRKQKDESEGPPLDRMRGREITAASDVVRLLGVTLVGPMALFGIYIVVHGQITPGGGFQGGVILAAAPLLIYLAGEFESLRTLAPRWLAETAEAIGAGGYAVIGASAMLTHAAFLTNFLPLGQPGDVFSGGTVALINLTVGLEVAGGFLLLLLIFLEETLVRRDPV
jgi:multicomponent Na+:H+ antiporter subunit B